MLLQHDNCQRLPIRRTKVTLVPLFPARSSIIAPLGAKEEIPMGFLAWIVTGLIAGWLAGKVMKGRGYGVLVDILLGLLGGVIGGWGFGLIGISPGRRMIGAIIGAVVR